MERQHPNKGTEEESDSEIIRKGKEEFYSIHRLPDPNRGEDKGRWRRLIVVLEDA